MVPKSWICYNPTLGQSVIPTNHARNAPSALLAVQSHARAIRHSDDCGGAGGEAGKAVTIPRSGNPSFRQPWPEGVKPWTSSYNPTLGQSVIPTNTVAYGLVANLSLQSPARAIRHSDKIPATAPVQRRAGYNPTLGQSVIPTSTRRSMSGAG